MTSVIYFVIVRTTRKPTVGVDDPPKIAGRYTKIHGKTITTDLTGHQQVFLPSPGYRKMAMTSEQSKNYSVIPI